VRALDGAGKEKNIHIAGRRYFSEYLLRLRGGKRTGTYEPVGEIVLL
jgi:hypothetical protein